MFGKIFLGEFFDFSKISLTIIFIFHSLCSGVARAPQAPRPRGGGAGLKGPARKK